MNSPLEEWENECRMELNMLHENDAFVKFVLLAKILGYEHVAIGLELPLSVADPWCAFFSNYTPDWQEKFAERSPKHHGPRTAYGKRTDEPDPNKPVYYWTRADFLREAELNRIEVDWCHGIHGPNGSVASVWMASRQVEYGLELEAKARLLAHLAATAITKIIVEKNIPQYRIELNAQEQNYLRWVLDGKTAGEIAEIMNVSKSTIDGMQRRLPERFHRSGISNTAFFDFRLGMLGTQ
jgi:LuxR family quorum-sensing system transcriptional regulator SolR